MAADVIDLRDRYRVEMDAPGMDLERITVSAGPVRGTLCVTAAPRPASQSEGVMLLSERSARARSAAYVRTIPIGWDADVGNAKPSLQNGVLRIVVPKFDASGKKGSSTTRDK